MMKQLLLAFLLIAPLASFSQGGRFPIKAGGGSVEVNSGEITNLALVFAYKEEYSTLTVDENMTLTLSGSGHVANSYRTIKVIGDGTHTLSFDADWVMLGDDFDATKTQEISFRYTGEYVVGVLTILGDIADISAPVLSSAVVQHLTPSVLNLSFNEATTITTTGWTLSASGGAVTVSSVASGSGTSAPTLQLSRSIATGETVTVSYDPALGATTDASGNELSNISGQSVTNNVLSAPTVLLTDGFTDGTIDADKWDVTDPADGLTISETGGRLRLAATPASPVASSNTNYVVSDLSFSQSIRVFRATIYRGSTSLQQNAAFKIYNASEGLTGRSVYIWKASSASPKITIRVYNGSTLIYDFTTTLDWPTTGVPVKVVLEPDNEIKVYYYTSGNVWTQLGATQTLDLGGAVKLAIQANSSGSDTGSPTVEFDTIYVTDLDYTGSTP